MKKFDKDFMRYFIEIRDKERLIKATKDVDIIVLQQL